MRIGDLGPDQMHNISKATKVKQMSLLESEHVLLNRVMPYDQKRY